MESLMTMTMTSRVPCHSIPCSSPKTLFLPLTSKPEPPPTTTISHSCCRIRLQATAQTRFQWLPETQPARNLKVAVSMFTETAKFSEREISEEEAAAAEEEEEENDSENAVAEEQLNGWRKGGISRMSSSSSSSFVDNQWDSWNISKGVNVELIVGEKEPIDSIIRRFNREVQKEGIMEEVKRRRFHETTQEKKKRKKRALQRAMSRSRRYRLRKTVGWNKKPRTVKDDDEDSDDDKMDNWDINNANYGF